MRSSSSSARTVPALAFASIARVFLKFDEFLFVRRRQLKLVTTDPVNLSGLGGNDGLG